MSDQIIYLDGRYVTRAEAKISVFDHAVLYGDGVFEGIRLYGGNVFRLEEHLERLWDSAHAIMLDIPMSRQEMAEAVCETCRRNELKDGYVRLVVTRGEGDLGLSPNLCPKAGVFIIAAKIRLYPEEYYENGLPIITAPTRRLPPDAFSPRIKSLNYLNNIVAKINAINGKVLEALMLNQDGFVVEATGDNVFLVKKGELITPPTWLGPLKGVTRDAVMELAADEGIMVREEPFTLYEVYTADEAFLTGTAAEVIAVSSVDGRRIGDGKPGAITRRLLTRFREIVTEQGVRI